MSVKKIITLATCPVNQSMSRVIHLVALQKEGISIEFWNLCICMFGKETANGVSVYPECEKNFYTLDDVSLALAAENLSSVLFLAFVGYEPASKKVYDILKKYGAVIGYLENMSWYEYGDLPCSLKLWLRMKYPISFIHFLYKKVFAKATGLDNAGYDLVFYESAYRKPQNSSRTIALNSVLYEEAMFDQAPSPYASGPYAVYLDTAVGTHPDILYYTDTHPSKEAYLSSLLHFFEKIENDLGLKVVIAAHPKANYRGDEFAGRPIYQGKTCALARNADLVLSDGSTSTLYAVAAKKPIIFFVNDSMLSWRHKVGAKHIIFPAWSYLQKKRATSLAMPFLNIDHLTISPIELPFVNEKIYDKEAYKWLTHKNIKNTSAEERFLETINLLDLTRINATKVC